MADSSSMLRIIRGTLQTTKMITMANRTCAFLDSSLFAKMKKENVFNIEIEAQILWNRLTMWALNDY